MTRTAWRVALVVALVVLTPGVLVASPVKRTLRTVSGVVKDPAGVPVPSVWLCAEGLKDRAGVPRSWRSDVDGKFVLEQVPSHEIVLRVMPGQMNLRAGFLVKAAADTQQLEVVVEPGPQFLGRIEGYEAPEGEPRFARLTWTEVDDRRSVRYSPVAKDGSVRFVNLPKDATFELWASAGAGRPVRSPGLRVSDTRVAIHPVASGSISGRVAPRPGRKIQLASIRVEAYPGFEIGRASPAADGSFTVRDLPQGAYSVHAGFYSGEVIDAPPVKASTGDRNVRLDLSK